ncbi:MAG TPA: antibiotic biosynthesis monooxygenase [Opitutaceae bacterium]
MNAPSSGFVAVWEFTVRAEHVAAFRRAYGAGGPWVALFRQSADYCGTELCVDPANPRRFVTIDRWTSPAAYRAFREEQRAAYAEIDLDCGTLTESERLLGEFEIVT